MIRFHSSRCSAGPLGAGLADGVEARHEDAARPRAAPIDAPVVVAHRCDVAHLGHGDEALVGAVLAADAVEEMDVAGRRQAA